MRTEITVTSPRRHVGRWALSRFLSLNLDANTVRIRNGERTKWASTSTITKPAVLPSARCESQHNTGSKPGGREGGVEGRARAGGRAAGPRTFKRDKRTSSGPSGDPGAAGQGAGRGRRRSVMGEPGEGSPRVAA